MTRPVVQCKELSCFSSNMQVFHGGKERSQASDSCFHWYCSYCWAVAEDCQPVWIVTASPDTPWSSGFCNTNLWYCKPQICFAVISSISLLHLFLVLFGISRARADSKKSLEMMHIKEMLLVTLTILFPFQTRKHPHSMQNIMQKELLYISFYCCFFEEYSIELLFKLNHYKKDFKLEITGRVNSSLEREWWTGLTSKGCLGQCEQKETHNQQNRAYARSLKAFVQKQGNALKAPLQGNLPDPFWEIECARCLFEVPAH